MPRRDPTDPTARVVRGLFRAQGGFLLISGLASAPLTWFIGDLFAKIARKGEVEISAVTLFCIEQRLVISLLGLIAAACGLGLLITKKGRWLWLSAGLGALLLVVALVLIGLIGLVGPLYEYRELG